MSSHARKRRVKRLVAPLAALAVLPTLHATAQAGQKPPNPPTGDQTTLSPPSAVSASTPTTARPRGVTDPGKLVFSDEFDGKLLNEAKWNARDQERTQTKRKDGLRWWYKPENVSVADGKLALGISWLGDNEYAGARVDSWRKFEFTYGTVEFRMHIPPTEGHLAAAWMQSGAKESRTGTGADGTEIDLIETPYQTDRFATSIHYDGYGADHKTASTRTTRTGLRVGYQTLALPLGAPTH
ncbi:family 16 glycosylhydrolase [Streptomyces sp. NPDC048331]|uniref:glycoside hydrolase family 16 protein n=1 Tax=Streptomyces sp. NPDC048331 TaxID=3365534 RepID=UPI0037123000